MPSSEGNGDLEEPGSSGDNGGNSAMAMMEMIKTMHKMIESYEKKVNELEEKMKTNDEKKVNLQPINAKDLKAPSEYDSKQEEYMEWHERFKNLLITRNDS